MKIKTLHAAFIALGMGVSSSVFAAADVTASDASVATVDFSGSVTSNTCQLATASAKQTVDLGEVKLSTLANNGSGPRHNFSIELVDCDTNTQGFEVTFEDANGFDPQRNYITNTSQGDGLEATGVGVMIADIDNGSELTLSQATNVSASVDASGDAWPQQTISFDAYLKGVETNPTAGYVNASATVSITTY
ncbi:TPA: fimbrial protein [Raoultella ornithinolytica]|uniref:fimbrial protein n=1 Tax=Raoultella ornithinolytica TaxID=54291 RepID=UPI0029CA6026|nr:fimbrial protein [Raoultella ornithinolytica]WPJ11287.1 fimbrial protein [Raoultella ornithinolytica]